MAQSPSKKLQHELSRIKRFRDEDRLRRNDASALLEWQKAVHPEIDEYEYLDQYGENQELSILTIQTYLREMRKFVTRTDHNLLEISANTFNIEIEKMESGQNSDVKAGGLKKTTLMVTQSAAQNFYHYTGKADPEKINVYGAQSNEKHDEEDMFTAAEVQSLRNAIEGVRNRAILEMLLNTGQRISAIQGLRIKDVDISSGYFYLNTDRSGLKGADIRGRRRLLLGARIPLKRWLEVHPLSEEPESFLFIGDPDHHKTKPDQPLCQGTIRRMLEFTAEKAGIDKPVNPHNFRHYWTTTMKQEYDLNDEEIKLLLGHKRSSNGLNQEYNHSVEEKLRKNTDWKIGHRDKPLPRPLTPTTCESCEEDLQSHWKLCPVCGARYGP